MCQEDILLAEYYLPTKNSVHGTDKRLASCSTEKQVRIDAVRPKVEARVVISMVRDNIERSYT